MTRPPPVSTLFPYTTLFRSPFTIEGCLQPYVIPHKKSLPQKNRLQLANNDHLVFKNVYVAGTLAGHRSQLAIAAGRDRKSTRLNSSHVRISYAVFCLKKKKI